MNNNDNNSNKYHGQSILYIALKRHRKGLLLLILVACISTSLAWFYNNLKVGMRVDGEVDSWNISVNDSGTYSYTFENISPGITKEHAIGKPINLNNSGAIPASFYFEVTSVYLFGRKYDIDEYNLERSIVFKDGSVKKYDEVSNDILNNQDKQEDDANKVECFRHTISGFPFILNIDVKELVIQSGGNLDINFTLEWPYEGDNTLIDGNVFKTEKVEGTEEETITEIPFKVPKCRQKILSTEVLKAVDKQRDKYFNELPSISIDGMNKDGEVVTEDTAVNLSTCDLIDTYYGDASAKFKKENEKYADKILEATKEDNTNYFIEIPDPAGGENKRIIFKDLVIELSMTVSQTDGYHLGKDNTSNPTS